MTNSNESLRCIGCGAIIQTTDKSKSGYVPKSALQNNNEQIYCQRCFKLRHYNQLSPVSLNNNDFIKLLNQIRDTKALVVCVLDIFDFNGSIIPGINRFAGNNPVLLVGNKADLLPKSFKYDKLKDWIRQQANREGIRPIDVQLVSAKTNQSVDELLQSINKYSHNRDVYIVGVTNVGKSTLINQIIKQSTGNDNIITTSNFPGTTLDQIKIPLEKGHNLIDTPGIIHSHQLAHYLSGKDLKIVSPQKKIKPKTYQLNSHQTIFMGGVGRFDYLKGNNKNGFTVYVENNLIVHRTKLSNANDFYNKHIGSLLTPPSNRKEIPELTKHIFKTKEQSDLVIEGLGWITVPSNVTIAGWAPKGVSVLIRKTMI